MLHFLPIKLPHDCIHSRTISTKLSYLASIQMTYIDYTSATPHNSGNKSSHSSNCFKGQITMKLDKLLDVAIRNQNTWFKLFQGPKTHKFGSQTFRHSETKSKHIHGLDCLKDQNIINFDRITNTCQY